MQVWQKRARSPMQIWSRHVPIQIWSRQRPEHRQWMGPRLRKFQLEGELMIQGVWCTRTEQISPIRWSYFTGRFERCTRTWRLSSNMGNLRSQRSCSGRGISFIKLRLESWFGCSHSWCRSSCLCLKILKRHMSALSYVHPFRSWKIHMYTQVCAFWLF